MMLQWIIYLQKLIKKIIAKKREKPNRITTAYWRATENDSDKGRGQGVGTNPCSKIFL